MSRSVLRKIVILGTTGSGKTTFLKNIVGDDFEGAEVKRHVVIEEAQVINTFTALDKKLFEDSTTTVSMNVQQVLFLTTRTNQFFFYPLDKKNQAKQLEMPDFNDMEDLYPTLIVDTAGQERFSFMQDIGLKGADGVIIFADGTNVQSIERIAHFYQMIQIEEQNKGKKIPIVVFVNKKDLEVRGMYVGKAAVVRWVPDLSLDIYETTNTDMDTFNIPIRNFLNRIEGFPVDISQIKINKVHEVY